ncbi:TetR/AcrR family transcriptional regulator, partial [Streptomyces sp. NPDC041003]|uniref:TetR/AcrR family transcriptional regulator n=1 Tax=Streptomyces sp. NPDC041003 TaxID=3155730 RepID=UPI0034036BB0
MATPSAPSSKAGTKGVPREHRRRQMLEAATEEFGTRGYAAASLPAIAARVGVTKTLLHQYFGTKEDLYVACLVPVGDRLLDAIRTAMGPDGTAPHTPLRVLHGIFVALVGKFTDLVVHAVEVSTERGDRAPDDLVSRVP